MRVYKKHTQKTACNYLIDSSIKDCFIVYCFEARYYRAPVFTSRDPLMNEKPWFTPYHYCSNNPVGRIDPTGCEDWEPEVTKDGKVNYVVEKGDSKESFQRQYNVSKKATDKIFERAGISNVESGTRISGEYVAKSVTNNTGRKYDDVLKLNWDNATDKQKVYHTMFALLCDNVRGGGITDLNGFINGLPENTGDAACVKVDNLTQIPLVNGERMNITSYTSSFSKKHSQIGNPQPPKQFINSDGTYSFNHTFEQYPAKSYGIQRLLVAFPSRYFESYVKSYYK